MLGYRKEEMDKEDLIKYCLMNCIKDNYIGKPEDDIELPVAQTLFNEMGQKGGLPILVDWSVKFYHSSYDLAKAMMDSLKKQKGKDKFTVDFLIRLARPFDEDEKLKDLKLLMTTITLRRKLSLRRPISRQRMFSIRYTIIL
jgi:hypothetical protein